MALDYDIYFKTKIKSEELMIGALKIFDLDIIKEETDQTIDLVFWENLGFNIFISKSDFQDFEIKNQKYHFNGSATIRFNKSYEELDSRDKAFFTIIRYLVEGNKTENLLCCFNGESIIVLKDKNGLVLNSNSGLISKTGKMFSDIPHREESFKEDDIHYL